MANEQGDADKTKTDRKIRYAVIGAGHIAQAAALPGFANAENSELVALFSSDEQKRRELGERYGLEHVHDYDAYDEVLARGLVDAVYIALPNHLHCDYTVRAARHGIHVLCEKPMAVDERECEKMIRATDDAGVKLMIAYRLHFDRANLEAIEIAQGGELGDLRMFASEFAQDVKEGDIRLAPIEQGGGPVYDMGVYCINAARYLFRDEPIEVSAYRASKDERRFGKCEEMCSAIMRFPGARLATFTSSFGAHDVSRYALTGSNGRLVMEPAYDYALELQYHVETKEGRRTRKFEKRDQFGAEIFYFSQCVLEGRNPEPDGLAGLADVHIVRSIHESAAKGRAVRLLPVRQVARPDIEQVIDRPGIDKPDEVNASGPSAD